MKTSLLFLAVFALARAQAAAPCKVFGISDSPQKLHCNFPNRDVALTCAAGKYLLNGSPITTAFHMDVEEGTSPLVFKFPEGSLTVMMDDPVTAELDLGKAQTQGLCKK
jgi:hypothetical protein